VWIAVIATGLAALVAAPQISAAEPPLKQHWAFQPIRRPALPQLRNQIVYITNDIDRFILAKLEAKGLTLNPEAGRTTLIRRVSFDLTGLPPTIAEIDRFLADLSPDAYAKMVDRYLASKHYGERWGKYWLDATGYADSNGYFSADSDRPLAWRYRDYVIDSFNRDKPYDRFVREQLAGDEMVGYVPNGDITPEMVEPLIATHFLRNAPDGSGESDGNPDEVRTDRFTVLEGNVQNMMNSLLGVTIQCARCHDHKFEPVTQEEYYGIQAILFPVYNPERWSKPNERIVTVGTRAERAGWQRKNDLVDRQVKALRAALAALADPLREQYIDERLKNIPPATRDKIIAAIQAPKSNRTPEQRELLKAHAKAIEISDDDLAKRFPEYMSLRDQVRKAIAEREKERPATLDKLAVFVETDPKPSVHHLLKRGLHSQPGDEVSPGVPASFSTTSNTYRIATQQSGHISTGRRTALANWITSPDNPLFARVMVNRIWQHHFGTGLVATPDNLGRSGAKPSHPELVDWLASELVNGRRQPVGDSEQPANAGRSPWSIKHLHRLILTSATYRQSSTPRDGLEQADPDNRLLGRFPLRRLDAEAVRDSLLAISGELDVRAGGPYVPSKRTAEGAVEIPATVDGAMRRSVYLQQRRTQVVTFLQLFDAPAMVATCGKRVPSTVPLQSLALLNSDFVAQRSHAFARRVIREAGANAEKRLILALRLVWGRPGRGDELMACRQFIEKQSRIYAKEKDADERTWADLCQMLLASNAFLYIE